MKGQRVYLGHIRDAVDDITSYAAVGPDTFMADRMRQDAVIRKLEIIGEAVTQLSDKTRQRRPEIPVEADCRNARPPDPWRTSASTSASSGGLSSATWVHWRLLSRPCCPTITCNQREVAGMRAETVGCLSMPPRERLSAIRSVSSESGQTQSRNRWHWREPSRPSTVLQRRGDASRLSTPRHPPPSHPSCGGMTSWVAKESTPLRNWKL